MKIKISANKLAEFITAKTPARRTAIVRDLKRVKKGYAPWYGAFRTPAKTFLEGGAVDFTILDRAAARMKGRTSTPWLRVDSAITAEAFKALAKAAPALRGLNGTFVPYGNSPKAILTFGDVEVNVTPDLIIHGMRGNKPLVGSLRFYLAKESIYQLGKRGAELVAVMQYHWLTSIATGQRAPETTLCIVLECFQERVTAASNDPSEEIPKIVQACQDLSRLWRLLDEKEAA